MTTNYERIKAMDIEEMAEFLSEECEADCRALLRQNQKPCPVPGYGNCLGIECFKQWLQAESEG